MVIGQHTLIFALSRLTDTIYTMTHAFVYIECAFENIQHNGRLSTHLSDGNF